MSFASPAERLALRAASDFGLEFVLQVSKDGRDSEIACDDCEHAMTLSGAWINVHNADYVEIFRVDENGNLIATIGGYRKGE